MHLSTIITSVRYGDFLQQTLGAAKAASDEILVVTTESDHATRAVCATHDVRCLCTDAWYVKEAKFNKSAGIRAALELLKPVDWVLLLDADIVLPPDSYRCLHEMPLDPLAMYGARRVMCRTPSAYVRYLTTGQGVIGPLPSIRNGKLCGRHDSQNPHGVQGYFQLWNWAARPIAVPDRPTAAGYDVRLSLLWPDSHRFSLPDFQVAHLGLERMNWRGRTTPPWTVCSASDKRLQKR